MFPERSHLYSLASGLIYGWLVVASPQAESLSFTTIVFDTLLKGAFFAFLLWIPSLFSEEVFLFSILGAIIGSTLTGGFDGATGVIMATLMPAGLIGYLLGRHSDFMAGIDTPLASGVIMLGWSSFCFIAFLDSLLLLSVVSNETLPLFFAGVLNEGRHIIASSQELMLSVNPDFSHIWQVNPGENDWILFRLFALPAGLACIFGALSIAIAHFAAKKMKFGAAQPFSFVMMEIPGRFVLPPVMIMAMFLGQQQTIVGFIILPLVMKISALYVVHGCSTVHFLVKKHPKRHFILILFYLVIAFVPFLGFLPLFLGMSEQLMQLKAKNVSIS